MKKVHLVVIALTLLAVPFSAQAKSCFWGSCNYITDGAFVNGGTYWTEYNTTYPSVASCLSGSPLSTMAQPASTGYFEQTFYVDDAYVSYEVDFDAFLQNDTENWWDQLKVTVTNLDTNVSETYYLHGNTYDSNCNTNVFPLQNDYDYADVKVRFEASYLGTGTWQVDNVAFWGHPF